MDDFAAAVNDDLNMPKAFAALFELVRDANGKGGAGVLPIFKRMDEVLGVIFFENEKKAVEIPADIQAILDQRAVARQAKNWAESDRLRDELAAKGWLVKDSKDGQSCTRKEPAAAGSGSGEGPKSIFDELPPPRFDLRLQGVK